VTSTDHRGRPRVVVTGMGVKTPAGLTVDSMWETLLAGTTRAATITLFDPTEHSVRIACEVRDFDAVPYVGPKEVRRTDRATLLAVAAAAGVGGIRTLEDQVISYAEKGPSRTSPFLVPMMMPNAPAAMIAIHQGWTGPNLAVATACATGSNAIGEGARMVREGLADVVVCGGTEASVAPVSMSAFARMGALSKRPAEEASRPFDVDRDGFVMGEGAGFVVLETLDHAVARGAEIKGEILGYGSTCDAFHITAPLESGAGMAACMEVALSDAGLEPSEIGHVNAHGTSTPHNEAAESAALSKVFGDHAVPVTSTKGVTGHLIGAAGAVEAIAALLSVADGQVPPTANHEQCDLPVDVVHGSPRQVAPAPALSTSFAFGGHNAALILGPPPGTDGATP